MAAIPPTSTYEIKAYKADFSALMDWLYRQITQQRLSTDVLIQAAFPEPCREGGTLVKLALHYLDHQQWIHLLASGQWSPVGL